ncbi:uncharacterized protein LOC131879318 [Tigriopus californicus]|uniref:uncharacterized protein LOC131879318 n=1 Tax=Tigriopus californicus TaxID=6832 RepID=UPI0027D9DC20|nr:uncharacterized protein LOC131879318 [Tigriopus californicus]|eukprot:TCALIF_08018-PA protein Name:"Similar to Rhov Rho-related GTP-binding protein RhoV (Bos taurus)" AED:0.01 eAED:0.01 QI:393/1/1/1/0.8/0.66/6/371/446
MDQQKNVLIAGNPGTGKTSLLLTMARGVFLTTVPKRFEGWTMNAQVPPPSIEVLASMEGNNKQKNKVSRTKSHGLGTNSSFSSAHSNGPIVSFTLWEDWSRTIKLANEDENEEDENIADFKGVDDNGEGKQHGIVITATPPETNEAEADGTEADNDAIAKNNNNQIKPPVQNGTRKNYATDGKRSERNPDGSLKSPYWHPDLVPIIARCHSVDDAAIVKPHDPCFPVRPFLAPDPDVILLCYSCCDIDSFMDSEKDICEDLVKRFPNTPIIVVGTKSDLRDSEPEVVSLVDRNLLISESCATQDIARGLGSTHSLDEGGLVMNGTTKFMVNSQMGLSLAKRIKASAFFDCSALTGQNISALVSEVSHILYYGLPSSLMLGVGFRPSAAAFSALARRTSSKKNSAPLALFQSSTKKRSSQSVYKSKAASFNFIKGSMTNIYHSATKD